MFSLLDSFSEVSVENKDLLLLTVALAWWVGAPDGFGVFWRQRGGKWMLARTVDKEMPADLGIWPLKRWTCSLVQPASTGWPFIVTV
jgi:hypothetical protein